MVLFSHLRVDARVVLHGAPPAPGDDAAKHLLAVVVADQGAAGVALEGTFTQTVDGIAVAVVSAVVAGAAVGSLAL